MMKTAFILFVCLFSIDVSGQQWIFGQVSNEDGKVLRGISVHNMNTSQRAETDLDGNFQIKASLNDELRFVHLRYERLSIRILEKHFSSSLKIELVQIATQIDEVEISYQPTGNLKEDARHFGDKAEVQEMRLEVGKYLQRPSTLSAMAPSTRDFVQPVRLGIPIYKITYKWHIVDMSNYLRKLAGDDYFIKELGLKIFQIDFFLLFALEDFEKEKILRYGEMSDAEYFSFLSHAEKKILIYRNSGLKK